MARGKGDIEQSFILCPYKSKPVKCFTGCIFFGIEYLAIPMSGYYLTCRDFRFGLLINDDEYNNQRDRNGA